MLPYGRQSIDESDIEAVAAVLRGDWLTTGPAVTAFEEDLARICGASRVSDLGQRLGVDRVSGEVHPGNDPRAVGHDG